MLTASANKFVESHMEETRELLRTLGRIPSPSHDEGRRSAFIKDWLEKAGAVGVYIDDAKNVIWPVNVREGEPVTVITAHIDIVFPDTEELAMHEENGRIYAPGIGDDTANVVNLLMASKYFLEQGLPFREGLLICANACEEGLGNLDGSKAILREWGSRVKEFISLDGGMTSIVNDAVGSERFLVHVQAEGGHSFGCFGNGNAIVHMADLIRDLYQVQVPAIGKTTYNVGTITGGTTINSIAEECEILYEFRSDKREALAIMEDIFEGIVKKHREAGRDISVKVLGVRPCAGDVPLEKEQDLLRRTSAILGRYTPGEIPYRASSTDCNIPLSMGIPACAYGTYRGAGAHTRGEWVELESLIDGQRIAMETLQMYI